MLQARAAAPLPSRITGDAQSLRSHPVHTPTEDVSLYVAYGPLSGAGGLCLTRRRCWRCCFAFWRALGDKYLAASSPNGAVTPFGSKQQYPQERSHKPLGVHILPGLGERGGEIRCVDAVEVAVGTPEKLSWT